MAKKLKKFVSGTPGRRSGEKFRRAALQFDKAVIACILVVVVSVVVAMGGDFTLRSQGGCGFALNFLWLPACLPLLLADGIASCFGGGIQTGCVHYIYLLGICDLVLVTAFWGGVRFAASRKQSANILKTARVFVLIIVIWGIFQLFCSGLKFTLDKSKLDDAVSAQITQDHK